MPVGFKSLGEIPVTVRFLNNDLDAALRAACTDVLRNNRPSHEYHKGGKAQLDYATIRRRSGNDLAPKKSDNVKSTSSGDCAECPNRDSITLNCVMTPEPFNSMFYTSASKDYRSSTQEGGSQVQVQHSRAQSRANQSMTGSPPKKSEQQRLRTGLQHSRSPSTPQWSRTSLIPQLGSELGSVRRSKPVPGALSKETAAMPLNDPTTQCHGLLLPLKHLLEAMQFTHHKQHLLESCRRTRKRMQNANIVKH
jgi:hypothetical protein